jgi:inner membrane protein
MDSLTHILFGVAIAGLAQLDPQIANSTSATQAIFTASIVGSVFPDLDTLYRVKGNGTYLRQHRGYTHSIPFLIGSAFFITAGVHWGFGGAVQLVTLFLFTAFALFLHVFTDVLNAYGTQVFRPFSKRRTAFNILPVIDPILIIFHLAGLSAWLNGLDPAASSFATLFACVLYTIWRWRIHRKVMRMLTRLTNRDDLVDCCWAIPTMDPFRWHIGVRSIDGSFQTGVIHHKRIEFHSEWRTNPDHIQLIARASGHDVAQALLEFSPHAIVQVQEHPHGTEIRWIDVRYQYRKKYPLLASVVLNSQWEAVHSFVGWSDDRSLQRKQTRRPANSSLE